MAIDTGSNAIKYRIWEIDGAGHAEPIAEKRFAVRLGASAFANGELDKDIQRDLLEVFERISVKLHEFEVGTAAAVATSAMREAANGPEVVKRIKKETGVWLRVLDGVEEARLIGLGTLSRLEKLPKGLICLLDIGGGSSEVILARGMEIEASRSIDLGAVRMQQRFFGGKVANEKQIARAADAIAEVLERDLEGIPVTPEATGLGVAGTISAITGMVGALDGGGETGVITLRDLERIFRSIWDQTAEEICETFPLEARRAEIILPGVMILRALMQWQGLSQLRLARGGVLDGLLADHLRTRAQTPAQA